MIENREVFIHETAVVEDGVTIGVGSSVWHHCHLRTGAIVGTNTNLGKNVYVDTGAFVGDNCKVQNDVSIYRGVTIENNVFVGPSAVFTNDLHPRASNEDWRLTPTVVREGATIGANATIVCGIEIGAWAFVAAGAVVTRNVAPHELVGGNPADRLGWVCECGEILERTRTNLTQETCRRCGKTTTT